MQTLLTQYPLKKTNVVGFVGTRGKWDPCHAVRKQVGSEVVASLVQ
jgi:hypothetical protein